MQLVVDFCWGFVVQHAVVYNILHDKSTANRS